MSKKAKRPRCVHKGHGETVGPLSNRAAIRFFKRLGNKVERRVSIDVHEPYINVAFRSNFRPDKWWNSFYE